MVTTTKYTHYTQPVCHTEIESPSVDGFQPIASQKKNENIENNKTMHQV